MVRNKAKLPLKYRLKRTYNRLLSLIVMISVLACAAVTFMNVRNIMNADTGAGETLETTVRNSAGSYYIGNNPSEINHKYFEELASALDQGYRKAAAEAVVKNFVAEYYTWTNKDGNYDLGGMQYIYDDLRPSFESYSRNNFYSQLHFYLNHYGRENLIQVKSVEVSDLHETSYSLTVIEEIEKEKGEEPEYVEKIIDYSGYTMTAKWSYEDNDVIDTDEFQNQADFIVVDHNGRMEIIHINGEDEE